MHVSIKHMTVDDFAQIEDSMERIYSNKRMYTQKLKTIRTDNHRNSKQITQSTSSGLMKSFNCSEYTLLFAFDCSHNHYLAQLFANLAFNHQSFVCANSVKQLFSKLLTKQCISRRDMKHILCQLSVTATNTKIEREIKAASAHYQKCNCLPYETLSLIQGFAGVIRPKFIPDSLCVLISQYYTAHMFQSECETVTLKKQDCIARVFHYAMPQSFVYAFKFRIIKQVTDIDARTVDVLVGMTDTKDSVQWTQIDKCQSGDVIEVVYDFRVKSENKWNTLKLSRVGTKVDAFDQKWCGWYPAEVCQIGKKDRKGQILIHYERYSDKYDEWMDIHSRKLEIVHPQRNRLDRKFLKEGEIYVFKNGNMVELQKQFYNLLKDQYYPCISFKSNTNFTHEILS